MQIILREWQLNDVDMLVQYANNPNIARFLTNSFPHPYTHEHGKNFISMANIHQPVNILAIQLNESAVGSIGLHLQTDIMCKNAELGYWIAEPFWGKGIASTAISKMVSYGFSNFDIDRIYARPFGCNIASQKVLEKVGFKLEARLEKTIYKDGVFHDELIYALRRKQ